MMIYISYMLCMSFMVHTACLIANAQKLKINSIGDWGDSDSLTYNTSQWAAETGEDGVLLVGDNFYPKGVASKGDQQFKSIFQKGFRKTKLGKRRSFWAIAGNHDHYGDVLAQVKYGKRHSYWKFPALNYTQSFKSADQTFSVFVVFTDSWSLIGGDTLIRFDPTTGEKSIRSKELLDQMVKSGEIAEEFAIELQQKFLIPSTKTNLRLAATVDEGQYQWIEQQLASADAQSADWLIVVGHYPVYSCSKSEHGDTRELVERLKPLLEKYGVDAYISGHDHILQHIQENGVQYFGSGAGAQIHSSINKDHIGYKYASSGSYGYMEHEFTKTSFKTTFYINLNGVKTSTYTYEVTNFIEANRKALNENAK